jgi:hypothetical protein
MNLTHSQTVSLTLLALAVLVTLLTSLVKTLKWSAKTTHTLTAVLSLVAGYVSAYFQKNGTADLTDVAKHFTCIYTVSQFLYAYALNNTALNSWLINFNLTNTKG